MEPFAFASYARYCPRPHLLAATTSSVSDYSIDTWQTEQGLPQDSVTAIVHTRDGYLWLGTYNGLVRFDGVRFKIFNTGNTPELADSRITSLFEDTDGTLWIGHETGDLTQLRAGRFNAVNLGNNWPGGAIWAMETDGDGVLWLFGREGALFSLQGAKLAATNMRTDGKPAVIRQRQKRRTMGGPGPFAGNAEKGTSGTCAVRPASQRQRHSKGLRQP